MVESSPELGESFIITDSAPAVDAPTTKAGDGEAAEEAAPSLEALVPAEEVAAPEPDDLAEEGARVDEAPVTQEDDVTALEAKAPEESLAEEISPRRQSPRRKIAALHPAQKSQPRVIPLNRRLLLPRPQRLKPTSLLLLLHSKMSSRP